MVMIERILVRELMRRGVTVEHEVARGSGHVVILTWAKRRLVVTRSTYLCALRDAAGHD